MKTQKGITLISITVYIIAMVIVIAIITNLTGYFYKNVDINTESQDINKQYTKFNSFFSEDINLSGNKIIEISEEIDENNKKINYIIFDNKNQYTFMEANKSIYFNQVKIFNNIDQCEFKTEVKNGKNTVKISIKGKNFYKETTYTLKN